MLISVKKSGPVPLGIRVIAPMMIVLPFSAYMDASTASCSKTPARMFRGRLLPGIAVLDSGCGLPRFRRQLDSLGPCDDLTQNTPLQPQTRSPPSSAQKRRGFVFCSGFVTGTRFDDASSAHGRHATGGRSR
jgi:hypothetical protein